MVPRLRVPCRLNHVQAVSANPSLKKGIFKASASLQSAVDTVDRNLLLQPKTAANCLKQLLLELRHSVHEQLLERYAADSVRRSIVAFIRNADSADTKRLVMRALTEMLNKGEQDPKGAVQMVFNYLLKLAHTLCIHKKVFLLPPEMSTMILRHLPRSQLADFFLFLLNVNIKFADKALFEQMKKTLLYGSNIEKFVARTGFLDAKWHSVNRMDFSALHKEKMQMFFSLNDLRLFANHAIKQGDIVDSNLYLLLLVGKLESDATEKNRLLVLTVMLKHAIAFKGSAECLKFLTFMNTLGLRIRASTLLPILSTLRKERAYDTALLLINYLHSETLHPMQKQKLVLEVMSVIAEKFEQHPKVAVGYFASIFGKEDESLHLLKKLGLLDLVYGDSEAVKKAEVHQDLTNSQPTHAVLRVMYGVIFKNVILKCEDIERLYANYMENVDAISDFDESLVTLFTEHLLKIDPFDESLFDLITNEQRYQAAKTIYLDFHSKKKIARSQRKVFHVDLLVTSAMLHHNDLLFAAKLVQSARSDKLPISFNQIYPFVLHHYTRGQYTEAEQWYKLIVENGVEAKSRAATHLLKIAKELKWLTKGTLYKSLNTKKTREARRFKLGLQRDNLGVVPAPRDANLTEQLSAILHTISR